MWLFFRLSGVRCEVDGHPRCVGREGSSREGRYECKDIFRSCLYGSGERCIAHGVPGRDGITADVGSYTSLPVLLINRLFCSIDYITNRNYRCQGLTVKTEFCLQPAIQSTIWTNRVQPKPHFTNVRSLDILLFHE